MPFAFARRVRNAIAQAFSRGRRRLQRRPAAPKARPFLEALEDRTLPTISVTANLTSLFTGDTIHLTANSSAGDSDIAAIDWDFNFDGQTFHADPNAANQHALDHPFVSEGTSVVAARVTDAAGAITTVTRSLTVWSFPQVYIWSDADPPIVNTPSTLYADDDYGLDPTWFPGADWDFDYDSQTFHAASNAQGPAVTPTFGTTGNHTVAARLTDLAGQQVVVTLPLTVHNPLPVLIVPPDFTVTAGDTRTLQVSAAGAGPFTAQWQLSFDGDDYEDLNLSGLTPSYTFSHYGSYDLWVRVTDSNGESSDASFHVTAQELPPAAPTARTSGPVLFGDPVTFTVTEVYPDDSDTISIYADWKGTGTFDEVQWDDNGDGSVRFTHLYDDASPGAGFPAVIRVENEGGQTYDATVNVVVTDPPTTARLVAGRQFARLATSGQDAWVIALDEQLQRPERPLRFVDISSAHSDGRRYHWIIGGVEAVTDSPYLDALPDAPELVNATNYSIYELEAFVEDRNGRRSNPQRITVLDSCDSMVGGNGDDRLVVPDALYGTLTAAGQNAPPHFNRFGNFRSLSYELGPQDPLVVTFTLDDASRKFVADNQLEVSYWFHWRVINTSVAWYDNVSDYFTGNDSSVVTEGRTVNPGATLSLASFGMDRCIAVEAGVQVTGRPTVNVARPALASPVYVAVATTPQSPAWYQVFVDSFNGIRNLIDQASNLVGAWHDRLINLVNAAIDHGPQLLQNLTAGLRDAVVKFGADLLNPDLANNALVKGLITWIGNPSIPELPPNISFDSIKNFLLQYSGLTWDHVQQVLREQLGAGNYAALERVASFVQDFVAAHPNPTATDIIQALPNLLTEQERATLGAAAGDLTSLSWDNLGPKLVEEAKGQLLRMVPQAVASLAAKFMPGAGLVSSIFQGVSFLINNADRLGQLMDGLGSALDQLIAGNTQQFTNTLVSTLEGRALPTFISFAAGQLGLGGLPGRVQAVVKFVPDQVDRALRAAVAKIAGALTLPGGTTSGGMFAGRLAAGRTVSAGNETYLVWAAKDAGGTKIKAARQTGTNQYQYLGELRATSFPNTGSGGPRALFNSWLAAADALARAPRNATLTQLQTLQGAVMAAQSALTDADLLRAVLALTGGCFAAGTNLWTPLGYRKVEDLQPGDLVYARDESDPNGPTEVKMVEERFERTGRILHVHLPDDKLIRTTPEHPFYVQDKGWTAAGALQCGDSIRTNTGWARIDDLHDTGEYEAVYNVRVDAYHTYFIGDWDWQFSVWAHNSYGYRAMSLAEYNQTSGANPVWADAPGGTVDPGYKWFWETQAEAEGFRTYLIAQAGTNTAQLQEAERDTQVIVKVDFPNQFTSYRPRFLHTNPGSPTGSAYAYKISLVILNGPPVLRSIQVHQYP